MSDWRPTPRQEEFLACSDDEVLFGGSAGGGKTDALVVDALGLQQGAVSNSSYRALLLRRTYDELREVVDRQYALYPMAIPGAEYKVGDKMWVMPSGARIELGYLDNDHDVYRYQSRQFQYVGWEELAQWPTATPYEYLMSRLRAPVNSGLICYARATCNPDGPGAKWIKHRWGIVAEGGPASSTVEIEGQVFKRRFIPSRLSDNPYLGPEYRARLMQLDDQTRAALLDGRWDDPVVGGAIYHDQIVKAREDGRITSVPHDPTLRVDTAWDLGVGDSTAIWFSQSLGKEVRLIDYYEANGEGLPHYAAMLDRKGYLYGRHVAPHDIRVREMGSGKSRLETAASLGIKFDVAPQLSIEDGIHAVRMLFPRIWVDEKKCAPGTEALSKYQRTYNSRLGEYTATPLHNWTSHCADAMRYLAVSHKSAVIKSQVVGIGRYTGKSSTSSGGAWMGN